MSAEIPKSVLSEHLRTRIAGRRVTAAVFTTMELDPGFFEQEVLPVVLGSATHHHARIRIAQLEDALRHVSHGISVYYDPDHLQGSESPKLDIGRIPVRVKTGVFHPKVILLLLEGPRDDAKDQRDSAEYDRPPERCLLVTALSANLTRSGWWSNVEVAHSQEIEAGARTRLPKPLTEFLDDLQRKTDAADEAHDPIRPIRQFLKGTGHSIHRSAARWMHPHFYEGKGGLIAFLRDAAGNTLDGLNLEVISPYFDKAAVSRPLERLIEEFSLREVRVFLPRNDAGEALCNERMFKWLKKQPDCAWGHLPAGLLRSGPSKEATDRFVHAKVYRFFGHQPKREYLFVGSPNLTLAGHSGSNNREAGFLVELEPGRNLDWWLEVDDKQPLAFHQESESDTSRSDCGTALRLRFDWNTRKAEGYWDDDAASSLHRIEHADVTLFEVPALEPGIWSQLDDEASERLAGILATTALLTAVSAKGAAGKLLVQETGMERRPSLLLELTPAEIMRYWATLDPEQRARLIEEHGEAAMAAIGGSEWVARHVPLAPSDSFFDRFAGIYQAFAALERTARGLLDKGETRDVVCRLFGLKQDSLEFLLDRMINEHEAGEGDRLVHYVTGLCARQMLAVMRADYPDFFGEHRGALDRIGASLARFEGVKRKLLESDPERMTTFLEWFEPAFLRRAKPVEREAAR